MYTEFFLHSNHFAVGEDCLQTTQDLQKHDTISDGNKLTLSAGDEDDNDLEVDDSNEDSQSAKPNTVADHNVKPLHKTGRGIMLK